ncbi:pirin family protein [Pedobacter chinensis]|uniref:Pirin family protein n=1 Tax=Pedobacter chinensis TaxID=2282421 RepID=A0A369PWF0_9SPHI|nr:pirin-like C-terminal cupin domain-containing protein [Pedobacter chinensis]RDC56560.1 pirin family protein [Pedobacter chinensis]
MNKKVIKKTDSAFNPIAKGLKGAGFFAREFPIEPFLLFSEFRMSLPVFGPHPHAGVSVMTYMRPDSKESFINRDNLSGLSFIEPGGLHIMQAGSGMHHDEFPKEDGVVTSGFQIWFNHSGKNRFVTPRSIHVDAKDVPEVESENALIRIVHGAYGGKSTMHKMVTDVDLLHIYLKPHKSITIATKQMAFVYGMEGGGTTESEKILPKTMINYSLDGDNITIKAGQEGLQFMLGTGNPHHEPIVYGGPFVATTSEQMEEMQRRYSRGEMGQLEPYENE